MASSATAMQSMFDICYNNALENAGFFLVRSNMFVCYLNPKSISDIFQISNINVLKHVTTPIFLSIIL